MNKTYRVSWSQTGIDELAGILAYPPDVKERIFNDAFKRLAYLPTLTAKHITYGDLEGYWVRHGLYQVLLIFEVDEHNDAVRVDGVKHKRQNVYWKKQK